MSGAPATPGAGSPAADRGWVEVAGAAALDGREVVGVEARGLRLALYRLGEDYFATSDLCTHGAARLSLGEVVDDCIECPLHGGFFEIRTGRALGAPVSVDLAAYPARREGDRLLVLLPDPA